MKEKTLDGTYVKSIESQEYAIVKEDQILLFFADLNKMLEQDLLANKELN